MCKEIVALIVPRKHVKSIKTALEEHDLLDRSVKIFPDPTARDGKERGVVRDRMEVRMVIPTKIKVEKGGGRDDVEQEGIWIGRDQKEQVLKDLGVDEGKWLDIAVCFAQTLYKTYTTSSSAGKQGNPLVRALEKYLEAMPEGLLEALEMSSGALLEGFPSAYSVYRPMLLLPAHSFGSEAWKRLLAFLEQNNSASLQSLWHSLASSVGATHIAINNPIPLHTPSNKEEENILRSPVGLVPLYGDFGPPPSSLANPEKPSQGDFDKAFWVSTTQNGIHQTWAPMYTMFSRGNITEKARVMNMESVKTAIEEGKNHSRGATAIDLYAGIGYFAFSYKKAGVDKVICFELNPWSVEGLQRGAGMNWWNCAVVQGGLEREAYLMRGGEAWKELIEDNDFIIFQESNERVLEELEWMHNLPPIRHINLGLLPSSRASWENAVASLDYAEVCWLHIHENIGAGEIERRAEEIETEILLIFQDVMKERGQKGDYIPAVEVEHVEKVKTFAPGVWHCVVDIRIVAVPETSEFEKED